MANEIHDSLAHTLYYARMRMSLLLDAVRTQNEQLDHSMCPGSR